MKLTEPVFQVRFANDVKARVIGDRFTYVVVYDPDTKETTVYIQANRLTDAKAKQSGKNIREYFSEFGRVLSVQYFRDGVEVPSLLPLN